MSEKKTLSKNAKLLITIIIAAIIMIIPAPSGLTKESMIYLAVFVWMLLGLILDVMPTFAVPLAASVALVLFKIAPFSTVFAPFSSSSIWMVICVVGFASCIQESGLMKRIAFTVLKIFKPTYNGQILAIMAASAVITPFIPSTAAKCAIMAPFAKSIADETGIEPHSKAAKGLWFAVWQVAHVFGPVFLTGATMTFILIGMLPIEEAAHFTWINWTVAASAWGLVILIGTYFVCTKMFKPEVNLVLPENFVKDKLAELGPMSSDEKFSLICLSIAVILWMTVSIHKIDSVIIASIGLLAMVARGKFGVKELMSKVPWMLVVMMGGIMGVSALMSSMGVTTWLSTTMEPLFNALIPNSIIFVLLLVVALFIVRLAVDSVAALSVMTAVFVPIAMKLGVSSWVVLFTTWVCGQQWTLLHNNVFALQVATMAGDIVDYKDIQPLDRIYMILCILGVLASIPLWTMLGIM